MSLTVNSEIFARINFRETYEVPNVQYFWWYGCQIYSTFGGMGAQRTVLLEVLVFIPAFPDHTFSCWVLIASASIDPAFLLACTK